MSSVAEKLQRKSQRATATKQVRLKLVYVDLWEVLAYNGELKKEYTPDGIHLKPVSYVH